MEYAQIIRRESGRLTSLIDNVLDFAKIEQGGIPYELEPNQDLVEVLHRVEEICRPRVEQAKMEFRMEIPSELARTSLDSNALVLAILNLVDNAIKYAGEGNTVTVALCEEENTHVVEVRDTGPGIAKDEQGHVFDRFYRAKDIRLKPIRGSGIGLALVRHIAEAHNGSVELRSTEGEGCTFRLILPILKSTLPDSIA